MPDFVLRAVVSLPAPLSMNDMLVPASAPFDVFVTVTVNVTSCPRA